MARPEWEHGYLEPYAAGREAFWHGRPIWANPLTGNAAREWTDGWKKGFGELVARTGEIALPSSAAEMRVRLAAHRPDDIPPEQRERKPTQNKVKPPKNAKAIWY